MKKNINELFDNPLKYSILTKDNEDGIYEYRFNFNANGLEYETRIFEEYDNTWTIEFGTVKGKGLDYSPKREKLNPFPVYATVWKIIKDFIETQKPTKIGFEGKKESGLGELYTKMIRLLKRNIESMGYKEDEAKDNGEYQHFKFVRLDEKLIVTPGNYGNVIIMSGGSASGKGTVIKNYLESGKYKVRDVDAWKSAFLKISKLKDKYPEIRNLNLKNADDVFKLHKFINDKNIKEKTLDLLLSDVEQDRLPNIIFDITGKNAWEVVDLIPVLINSGYSPTKINLIWTLSDYRIAIERNKKRSRTVPEDILLKTHEGSAKTFLAIARGDFEELFTYLNGGIYVVLNNDEHVVYFDDNKKVIKDFTYFQIKKPGKEIIPFAEFKELIYDWIKKYAPEGIIES